MILTCPSCANRYIVDPTALGAEGRMVRCANCSHTWHQAAPMDLPKAVDLAPPPDGLRPIPPGSNLPAFPEPAKRASAIGWLVFLIVLLGGLAGIVLGRHMLVEAWAPAARLYDMVGLSVDGIGAGLELRNVTSARRDDAGASVIVVEGTIANVSNRQRDVPRLRAVVRSAARQDLKDWVFPPGVMSLNAGETANFRYELPDPPRGATDLAITFVSG
jgi:predicted Zn finger-like uncharacterized protein